MKLNLKKMILAGIFAALTAILAQIGFNTPFTTVPVTLEILAVCLAGAVLGSRYAALSQIVFILLGICGIPVFANFRAGIGVLAGPTGGYILSFPIIAFIIGYIIERKKQVSRMGLLGLMLLGIIICYAIGTVQLALVMNLNAVKAISIGIIPFVPFDILKIIAASFMGYQIRTSLLKAGLLK